MIELRLLAAARHEFDEAIDWYAAQSLPTAERFEAAVDDEFKAICRNPQRNPKWNETHRFKLVPGFPYYIVYRTLSKRVEIVAVFHTSRDPTVWVNR
jgi:toxin ParE1/3/4